MAYIEWNDDISVGIKILDEDHKKLVNMINELHIGILAGAKESTLGKILNGLIDYSKFHFKNEEDLMVKHGYPELNQHRKIHNDLVNQIVEYIKKFETGKSSFSIELMAFLRDWLINHIKGTDMKYKEFFLNKGVE